MTDVISQAEGLEVNEVPDGYIIYQGTRDRVHYLNKTAAVIFEFCDGNLDADSIVARVAQAFEIGDPAKNAEIAACLGSLMQEGLIQSHSK